MTQTETGIPRCRTWNDAGQESILIISGAFASTAEWEPVASEIPEQYHVLVPSLGSSDTQGLVHPDSLTVESVCKALADLVQAHTKDKKAHVVGHSLGAAFAVHLAAHYPNLVWSVFVSGYTRFSPTRFMPALLSFGLDVQSLAERLPSGLLSYALGGDKQPENDSPKATRKTRQEIVSILVTDEPIAPVQSRTLVVAAIKGGLIPTNDNIDKAKWLLENIKRDSSSKESRGVTINERHGWNSIEPSRFAKAMIAWIEKVELPDGVLPI